MTPREWNKSSNPLAMLDLLYPLRGLDSVEPQTRTSRLYLLACGRRIWDRLPGVCKVLLSLAEDIFGDPRTNKELRSQIYPFAEALVLCRGEMEEINTIGRALESLGRSRFAEVQVEANIDPQAWGGYAHLVYGPFDKKTPNFLRIPPELHSARLVREIFGNPLERPPPFDPQWRTDTVIQLARHANQSADFGMLPILADALQDAGCEREDLLDHLRSGSQHTRGCWVLETILNQQ